MKNIGRMILVAAIAAAPPLSAAPTTKKTVILDCAQGWHGDAGGQYGGVGFTLSCENGISKVRLEGVSGGNYFVRMGVESSSIGADCFYTGTDPTVRETCIGVRINIL